MHPHTNALIFQQKKLSNWLFISAMMIFIMIVLGGLTRLTGSGLSIVHWQPLSGILPPVTLEGWQTLFQGYQHSPEYQKINYGMSLQEFKGIFWLEFIHRLWGRLIGIIFLIPLILAWREPQLRIKLFPKLLGIWILGGLQGVVGWYMVKSGLIDNPEVSHYRLALHLFLGFITYGLTLHCAINSRFLFKSNATRVLNKPLYWILCCLFGLTVFYGALVAGLKAGLIYNTFPTMDGNWVPQEFSALDPLYKNFLENHATVQWTHRILASLTVLVSTLFWWKHRQYHLATLLLGAVYLQATLGIFTLLFHVPVALGTLHQAGALAVLSVLVFIHCKMNSPTRIL